MKPGAEKLFNYLKENKELNIEKSSDIYPFWTIKAINRFVKEYKNVFIVDDGIVRIKGKKEDMVSPSIDRTPFIDKRSRIVKELEKFLVGPFEPNEHLGSKKNPMALYLTGKLVPFGSTEEVVNEEENQLETKQLVNDELMDEMIVNRHVFRPSTMGYSFKMKSLCPIKVKISWGMYDDKEHQRIQLSDEWTFIPENETFKAKNEPLENPAKLRCKMKYQDGLYHVSLFLMNSYKRDTYPIQSEVMFQTKMITSIPKKNIAVFSSKADEHNYDNELLYGHYKEYTIGHGVGVDWKEDDTTVTLESMWLPFYEMPIVEHRKLSNARFFMKELSEMSERELRKALAIIPDGYKKWLNKQEKHLSGLESHLKKVAESKVKEIKRIIDRVEEGIELLCSEEEKDSLEAFRFANKVMMIQQAQSKVALEYRSKKERITPVCNGEWRLFQITFLLMNISGIVQPNHEDRDVVDLIWFPTGGGKTEAYLGVAAFTMAYRRLTQNWQKPAEYAGVTIFMRYTLRLLTTQQFQRATAMVCAAESIRRNEPHKFGIEPFRIGLWIGTSSSPNTYDDAKEKLKQIMDGNEVLEGNPMQLTHCPWCGTELLPVNYEVTSSNQKIRCNYYKCEFSSGIPALTIDEAIYQFVPTVLIGTVDKVAQIAWKSNMYELFGNKTHYHPEKGFIYDEINKRGYERINRLKPPELIIQDELHLISGPLGSMTGLYELAIDYLCQYQGRGPKIIASTATIRGADEQVRRLYGREVNQFPLPVVKATDNFVSYEVETDKKPGRLYLGVCAPGVSGKIHTIHVYSALLTISSKLKDNFIDPYWTILGYFNTVKELAGTTMLFKDEIPVRLKLLGEKIPSRDLLIEEMTSRKKAREIPQLLSQMEKTVEEEGVLNAVLATNMISVGVDVNRLGLMVMHNQPKTSSEYIQATSRVGRAYPGLVLTMFNSLRSRDLSHYERFKAYHSAIYRYVEPTSVTSFSQGSRRRGLNGVLVGAIRQSLPLISKEQSASLFQNNSEVEQVKQYLLKRAEKTNEITEIELETEIEEILSWWSRMAEKHEKLAYRKSQYNNIPYLLRAFDDERSRGDARPAMHSLRNVEGSIKVSEVWEDD